MKAENIRRAAILLRVRDEIKAWQGRPNGKDRERWDIMRADFCALDSTQDDGDRDEKNFGGCLMLPVDLYDAMLSGLRANVEVELIDLGVEDALAEPKDAGHG